MSQRERNNALSALRGGRVSILVATDVAARGLDIDAVSHVIQYGLPQEPRSLRPPQRTHRPRGPRGQQPDTAHRARGASVQIHAAPVAFEADARMDTGPGRGGNRRAVAHPLTQRSTARAGIRRIRGMGARAPVARGSAGARLGASREGLRRPAERLLDTRGRAVRDGPRKGTPRRGAARKRQRRGAQRTLQAARNDRRPLRAVRRGAQRRLGGRPACSARYAAARGSDARTSATSACATRAPSSKYRRAEPPTSKRAANVLRKRACR